MVNLDEVVIFILKLQALEPNGEETGYGGLVQPAPSIRILTKFSESIQVFFEQSHNYP